MPQESRPSDIPSLSDVEDEVAGIDNPQENDVRNALQDIVVFAQDFLNVLDDLVHEQFLPQAIHFPRPLRPAGRFALQARGGGNVQQPVRPVLRPAVLGRLILGGDFNEPMQPGAIPAGDAGLLDRGVDLGDNLRDPIHPDDMNAEGGGLADVGAEAAGSSNMGAEFAGSSNMGAEFAGSSNVGAEFAGSFNVGAEFEGSSNMGAEAAVDEEAGRIADLRAEILQPAMGWVQEWVQPEVIGADFIEADAVRADTIRIPVEELAKPVASALQQESDVPVPIKRARLDDSEGGSSKQREEGVLHYRSKETSDDSSESNGDQ